MNNANLMRLAVFLNNLPIDYAHFNMVDFVRRENGEDALPIEMNGLLHTCGTTACALGHTPFVPKTPVPMERELWGSYIDRVYGMKSHEMRLLFDTGWNKVDGSAKFTAKRIWMVATNPVLIYGLIKHIHAPNAIELIVNDPLFGELMDKVDIPKEIDDEVIARYLTQ